MKNISVVGSFVAMFLNSVSLTFNPFIISVSLMICFKSCLIAIEVSHGSGRPNASARN